MSIPSRACVRTWTALVAFAAAWLACPAAGRGEQAWYAALDPNMQKAFTALVEKPTPATLQAVRELLVADRAYDPYSDDLTQLGKLAHDGKSQEVIALWIKSQPNLLLSPRAHRLAAEAAEKMGDKKSAAAERHFAARCADGILATGDGSDARPFLVAHISDEADVLKQEFHTQIDSQGLIFRDETRYDKVLGKDGRTYWFDVSMLMDHVKAGQVPSAAAAASGGPAAADGQTARVTALVERGRDAYRAGQDDVALAALSEAIALDPRNAGIRVDRGNVWYVKEEYAQAVSDFSAAIRLDPNCATAYGNRAFVFNMLGVHDQAITDFNAAIRLQANFSRAYNGRGLAFQAVGMTETAVADFDEAIRLNPNYAAAYENRSAAYFKLGNQSLADADAAKARQLRGVKASPPAPNATVEKTADN